MLEFLDEAKRFARLHYVSTAYVSGKHHGTFRETDLDVGQGFKNHYEETKFLAEVEVAKSRVPRTIYRPGVVVGDSRTGETGKFDGPYFVLRAMERLPSPGLFIRLGQGRARSTSCPWTSWWRPWPGSRPPRSRAGRPTTSPIPHPTARWRSRTCSRMAWASASSTSGAALAWRGRCSLRDRCAASSACRQRPWTTSTSGPPRRHRATADLRALGVECPALADYVPRLVAFYLDKRDEVRREAMI